MEELYGDDELQTLTFSSGNPRVETTRGEMYLFPEKNELPARRNEQLCVLGVPDHMTGADFCQFTGSFFQSIKEMRIVRNEGGKDIYSVLMKFENQDSADEFFQHFNGRPFSSMEPEICYVHFLAGVRFATSGGQASAGLGELPTCPVCLDRLDQHVNGVLITVCNHSFHTSCISKWTDSSCPVCRYCQQKYENSTCSVCSTTENLWICVVCGFVGCGRKQEGHALRHWRETQHCYSLELETQRVWDYVGDNYVHRLIQSKTDGQPVELNAPCIDDSECSRGTDYEEAISRSKLDAAKLEYEHLLTVQMESQRQYFEEMVLQLRVRDKDNQATVDKVVSEKAKTINELIVKAKEEMSSVEKLNESLRKDQEEWKTKFRQLEERQTLLLKERDDKIADLEEQVRDYTVFLEAQKTISKNSDMLEGSLIIGQTQAPNPRTRKAGRRKK